MLVSFFSRFAAMFKPTAAPVQATVPDKPAASGLSDFDRDTLIRTLFGEARSESEIGQMAVVHVIRNRMKRPKRFRATAAAVCKQPWQFSCWNDGDPNLPRMTALKPSSPDYLRLGAVVDKAWLAEDVTDGADHYYAAYIARPRWAEPPARMTRKYGAHMFFANVA